ncbi:DNA polymerase Y family protein [Sinomonas sp. JGH33]|uniref:DNA polymerase Y family protein n=1 Tax=Sinomonas terricola TaxID=3110330 RepID=A0ABU5T251_9MICC|nr:DNA polymerase Y family protein [Sinomonas sp. JGH33]MEA5453566.1 DNA polymerase Y family protein [Sinomonas sp. JGH33]
MSGAVRALVVWFPDWPLVAAQLAGELPDRVPAAVMEKGRVAVCSAEARSAGVVRGLRLREAQSRCPDLVVVPADAARDAREFEPTLLRFDETLPGVQVLRPGLCVLRARGAARYYGSEEAAGGAALEAASRLGLEVRAGIADSVFAAEQAARTAHDLSPLLVLAPGASPAFLAPLPVRVLGDPKLASLLVRLGIRTLGDFAALPPSDVRSRFGPEGLEAHARARGEDARAVAPRVPPPPLERVADFEPGLDRVDRIAFAIRPTAEEFVEGLRLQGLACTELRVQITDDAGQRSERCWGHPQHFGANDVVDRVRWQLQSGPTDPRARSPRAPWRSTGDGLAAPVVQLRLSPERTDRLGRRGQALFGGVDERLDHGLRRLQSMLGHGSVLHPVANGGRLLAERCLLLPWGEAPPSGTAAHAAQPWPGTVPEPLPATVFPEPLPVELVDDAGSTVRVGPRGDLMAPPAWFRPDPGQGRRKVRSWAGPWPLRQRWWDADQSRHAERFQILDGDGEAWLLLGEDGAWRAEARYD